jgi:hypothetical protein
MRSPNRQRTELGAHPFDFAPAFGQLRRGEHSAEATARQGRSRSNASKAGGELASFSSREFPLKSKQRTNYGRGGGVGRGRGVGVDLTGVGVGVGVGLPHPVGM